MWFTPLVKVYNDKHLHMFYVNTGTLIIVQVHITYPLLTLTGMALCANCKVMHVICTYVAYTLYAFKL